MLIGRSFTVILKTVKECYTSGRPRPKTLVKNRGIAVVEEDAILGDKFSEGRNKFEKKSH